MKIQCDVCDKEQASVFCSADEAALCETCDRRVHRANKLASKHLRFSLHHPSSLKDSPHCDICQDRRALLFCQEDRAILCRECDVTIHGANEHTKKHNRSLFTGVKLSVASSSHQVASSSSGSTAHPTKSEVRNAARDGNSNPNSSSVKTPPECTSTASEVNSQAISQTGPVSSSGISDYLNMETLSTWPQVEDFLDPSCSPYGSYF